MRRKAIETHGSTVSKRRRKPCRKGRGFYRGREGSTTRSACARSDRSSKNWYEEFRERDPERKGLEPSYEERHFEREDRTGRLALIVSDNADNGAIKIHQDVDVYATALQPGDEVEHSMDRARHAWVQVVDGEVTVNGELLHSGDGAAISDEGRITLAAKADSAALLFDLA